jgi:hypothetical protein
MADYSVMKSNLEKNYFRYFTFSPILKRPSPSPDTPVEDISNSTGYLGFKVFGVNPTMVTPMAPIGQTHVNLLPLFLLTLKRNIKPLEIFKLNSLA